MHSREYGAARVTWGANKWVLVETPRGSAQRQVARKEELRALLAEVGLLPSEVERIVAEAWKDRPAEARLPMPSINEPQYRTAGMSQGVYALLLVAGLVAFVVVYGFRLG